MTTEENSATRPLWPADQVERWPVDDLVPYANNARTHSSEQVDKIAASIREFGFTVPVLAAEDGTIIAGHGRILAAEKLGLEEVPVVVARGWSEEQRRAYTIADNQLTLEGGWDEELLRIELTDLQGLGFNMALTGFDEVDLGKLLQPGVTGDEDLVEGEEGEGEADEGDGDQRGQLLSRMDITIADPRHEVALGDHFILDGRHHLIVAGVMRDWPKWSYLLTEGSILCPYPGPFTPFGSVPQKHALVMVQPDTYIAGHILDRYADAFGESSVEKVEQ